MSKVMIVLEATDGGTARHVVDLAVGCHWRGLDVHLVCATRRVPEFRNCLLELKEVGITVHELDMWREPRPLKDSAAAVRLRRLILNAAPDVLHLHSSKAGALGRAAIMGLGQRRPVVVYTPHCYAFLAQAGSLNCWLYRQAERAMLPLTDYVVAVSESEARAAGSLGAKGRVIVIPNGVNAKPAHQQHPKERRSLRVGWLGRLAWQKDPEAAVRVSHALSKIGVDHELLLAGDGPARDQVRVMIRELQAESRVRMLGFVRDTDAFYARIDMLLMTSRAEGLSYAGLDAMARRLPVVGFDVPGVRDMVEPGVTGLLAAPGDAGALAAHIARLGRDRELLRAFGVAAQRLVWKRFQLKKQLDRLTLLYQSLVESRAAPSIRDRKDVVGQCFNFSYTE